MIPPPTVQTISEWALVIAFLAVIGILTNHGMRREVSQIKHQVKNDHPSNLRDDVDRLIGMVETQGSTIESNSRAIGRVEGYVRDVSTSVDALSHSMQRGDEIIRTEVDDLRTDFDSHVRRLRQLFSKIDDESD